MISSSKIDDFDFSYLSIKEIAEKAINNEDLSILQLALNKLSIRIVNLDIADIVRSIGIVYHTASKLGEIPENFLLTKFNDYPQELQQHILSFIKREPGDKTLEAMGYREEVHHKEFRYISI